MTASRRALMLPLLVTLGAVASGAACAAAPRQAPARDIVVTDADGLGVMRALGVALRADYGASVVVDRELGIGGTATCVTDRAVRCVAQTPALIASVAAGTPTYAVGTVDSTRLCSRTGSPCPPGGASVFITVAAPVFTSDTSAHVVVTVRSLEGDGPLVNESWVRYRFSRSATEWRRTGREAMITG